MPTLDKPEILRRPLASRSSLWARNLSGLLIKSRITPNQISVFSIFWALVGSLLLIYYPYIPVISLVAAVCVQLRLLCNLMDGMVAVEGNKSSPSGMLFNEIPDRITDSLFLVAMGYACDLAWLGWASALLAACTAYIRALGGAIGLAQSFSGIMSKPRRMAALTIALILNAVELFIFKTHYSLFIGAIIIAIGSLVTCATRTLAIARQLEGDINV